MATVNVTFLPANITTQAETGERITDVAARVGIDIPMSCGGNCACSTCRIIVKQGDLTPASDMEQMWGLPAGQRLGCQSRVMESDIIVEVPL